MKNLTKEEKSLLLNILSKYTNDVPIGLDPTFYLTGSYIEDVKVQKMAINIQNKLK